MQLGVVLLSAGWLGAFLIGLRLGQPTLALALYGAGALAASYRALRGLRDQLRPRAADLGLGLALGAALVAATRLIYPLAEPILGPEVERMMAIGALSWPLVPATLVVIVAEELIWRGLALQAFSPRGRWLAAGLSTLLYTGAQLATGSWVVALAALGLGGVWAAVAAWRRNLWAPLLAHAAWTLTTLGLPLV